MLCKCCVLHAMASPALACSGVSSPCARVCAFVLLRSRRRVRCEDAERAHRFTDKLFLQNCSSVFRMTHAPCRICSSRRAFGRPVIGGCLFVDLRARLQQWCIGFGAAVCWELWERCVQDGLWRILANLREFMSGIGGQK